MIKKREIIEKSIGVIFEKGYNGSGVKDLADAAGIPKGSIYNYFENKEDYLKEALIYYYEVSNEGRLQILSDQSLSSVERISKFFEAMIDALEYDDFKRGCLLGKITQEVSGVNESIRKITEEIQNNIIEKIANNIKEAKNQSLIGSTMNEFELAEFIYNSWQGTLIRIKSTRDKKTLDIFYKMLNGVLLK
ncbi:MAG: TetR/AcrR family transcriptional regulator [Sarcina sp.]